MLVADIAAIVIHLHSAEAACELLTGRAPPLAVSTEVNIPLWLQSFAT